MKRIKLYFGLAVALGAATTGCVKNQDIDHPDFDYQTVYFPYQTPVRTLLLGDDAFVDNTLDNQRKVEIKATLGGTRDNKSDVVIPFEVDPTLVNNLFFPGNVKILPLPDNYYTLASNQLTIPKGSIIGGVQVQFTDAFFADPLTVGNKYVLPLKMKSVQNADSILKGKDFVLYAIKYVNPYHGYYLRRGVDLMTRGTTVTPVTRHKAFVESDEVNMLKTRALNQLEFPVVFKDGGDNFTCTLLLTFDEAGNCSITTNTNLFTATGTGKFVRKGEKKSWGNKDRDGLYLDYQITYNNVQVGSNPVRSISGSIATKDTLVMRDRAVLFETFAPLAQ